MFKVNNKDTRMTPMALWRIDCLLFSTIFSSLLADKGKYIYGCLQVIRIDFVNRFTKDLVLVTRLLKLLD